MSQIVKLMYTIGHVLRKIREDAGLSLQDVQLVANIDISLLSRIENGKRLPSTDNIKKLSLIYSYDFNKLLINQQSDKILNTMEYPELALKTLKDAENKIIFGDKYLNLFNNEIYEKPIYLDNRRYIGSKTKLADWIMSIIDKETENVNTFSDIFAGTAAITNRALKKYNKVIINDILYSNNVIYKAFFADGQWNKNKLQDIISYYNKINSEELKDNYFSDNFGDKYYEKNIAKQIGYIRENIEDLRIELTDKEYNILLATLLYSIDRLANTVGHFDAYIKKDIDHKHLRLRLIDAQCYSNAKIYRMDSNLLAHNIESDIVYIDPPYNSRQYSSAYHLLENLTLWKKPELFGVARKPLITEGKSAYCTNNATIAFEDLIQNLKTRYILLSYNNMANKGNDRSNAKISDHDIFRILENKGQVKVFSQPYKAFSTGKSNITNNEERIFFCKVK